MANSFSQSGPLPRPGSRCSSIESSVHVADFCPFLEQLEPRIAPASFTFTDVDGDLVVIKTSKGSDAQLEAILVFHDEGLGQQLRSVDFSKLPAVFNGTTLTILAKPGPGGGDGLVNVGEINASFTGGNAVINSRLWGKALIKEGPGILKLTRDNRNGGGGGGVLDGLIVREGFVEFADTLNLNDGGFLNRSIYNEPGTGERNIQLNGGGLRWAPGSGADISARLRVLNNFHFDTNGNNVAFGTSLAGTNGMTKWGPGTLTLAPVNSYSGGTTIKGGLIAFASLATLGTGNVTLDGGGLRWADGNTVDVSGRLAPLAAGGGVLDTNGGNITLATGSVTGSGPLTKVGDGTLTFQGTHPWTGELFVQTGTVAVNGNLNGKTTLRVGSAGGASLALGAGAQLSTTSHARIGLQAGETGNATVSGANAHLNVGDYLEIGSSGAGTLTISQGGKVSSGTSTALGVIPGSLGTMEIQGASSTLEVGGSLLVGYQSTGTVNIANGGLVSVGDFVELGSIFGASGVVDVQTGGTLRVGGADGIRLGTGIGAFALSGGTLEVHQNHLSSSVPVVLTNTSTVKAEGFNAAFAGAISGTGSLVKTGSGILYLNVQNSYSGGTTLQGGQIIVPGGNSLGSGPIAVLNGNLYSSENLTREGAVSASGAGASISAAGFMEFGATGTGTLAVSGGAQVSTPNSVALGVGPTAVGQADIVGAGSSLNVGTTFFVGFLGTGGVNVAAGGSVTAGTQLLLGGDATGVGTFTVNPGGTLNIGGTNGIAKGTGAAAFHLAGGLLKVTGSSLTTSVPMTLSNNSTVDTSGVEATLSGALSGSGQLHKIGAGTLTLSGANSLASTLHVWVGTVRATTAGSLTTGAISLNGGTLALDYGGTATVQSLSIDGAVQSGGLWGGLGSEADFKTALITGPGMIQVLSSTLPPSFNQETQDGLKVERTEAAFDLFAATGVNPVNGTFSGFAVNDGKFFPDLAGFGLHTITYTAGEYTVQFTISVIGGVVLEEEGGTFAPSNIAPGGVAFAKDVINHPAHSIAALNNGSYGNASSWIGGSDDSYAGVVLGAPTLISRIAFGRDNTDAFDDRAAGFYAIQITNDADPTNLAANWTTIGAVDYRSGGTAGVSNPALRHLLRFEPVIATDVRVVPGFGGAAIDEIEVYPNTGLFIIGGLTLLQEGGGHAPGNVATGGTAFAQNVIASPHSIAGVNDGVYGNSSSWIGTSNRSFIGVAFAAPTPINRLAFSRDNTGQFDDRTLGRYTVQVTGAANPDASTPDAEWTTLGTLDAMSAAASPFATPARRHLYGFPETTVTGLRILTDTPGVNPVAIDEIEIYLGAPAIHLTRDGDIAVPPESSVDFGATFSAIPVSQNFTLTNNGTQTLNLGVISLVGAHASDFTLTPPSAVQLQPGQSNSFTVHFTPGAFGSRNATLQIASDAALFSFSVSGSGLVPTFNAATTDGLAFDSDGTPVDLADVTEASPAGGVFSGPGVSGGLFDPSALPFGLYTISYTVNGETSFFSLSVVGGLTLAETGGSFAPDNLAPLGTAFAKDEIGIAPHAIENLNDASYGNPSSWIADSPVSHAGVDFGGSLVAVGRVAFGRDNTGSFLDRARGVYTLQYTTHPVPADAPAESWISIGAVDTRGFTDPHLRRLYSFPVVAATGLRLVVHAETDYIAIDEIELYAVPMGITLSSGGLRLLEEGGGIVANNLADGGTAFAKDEIGVPPHSIPNLNNGTSGNASSWIAGSENSFVGISLGTAPVPLARIAFGRDNAGIFTDRTMGHYTLQYTTVPNPGASTPNEAWITIGTLDYQQPGGLNFNFPARRHLFGFDPVEATGLRLLTSASGGPDGSIAIDEFEIYAPPSLRVEYPAGITRTMTGETPVPLAFGPVSPGTPSIRTITLINEGTGPLSIEDIRLEGGDAARFLVNRIGVQPLLGAGESAFFTVTLTPTDVSRVATTLIIESDDPETPDFRFALSGNQPDSTPPVITVPGDIHVATDDPQGATVNFTVSVTDNTDSEPSFTISHPSGSFFPVGSTTVTVVATDFYNNSSSASFVVTVSLPPLVLRETGGTFAPNNLAAGKTAFAKDVIDVPPHTIAAVNDGVYGNASSWIAGTKNSFVGINLGAEPVPVQQIAFGRDNTGVQTTRAAGTYTLQFTTTPNPDETTPDSQWLTLGTIVLPGDFPSPHLRHRFAFLPVEATGIRLLVDGNPFEIGIDEIELYGYDPAWEISLEQPVDHPLVHNTTVIDFGEAEAGSSGETRVFTLRNAGIFPVTTSNIQILGTHASHFVLNTSGTSMQLAPGDHSTLAVTFQAQGVGERNVTLRVTSTAVDTPTFDVPLTGLAVDTIPPVISAPQGFTAYASHSAGVRVIYPDISATDNTAVTLDVTPANLSFLPPGTHTVTITATDSGNNSSTATFDVEVLPTEQPPHVPLGGSVPANLATGKTPFAKDVINVAPHSIAALNDGSYGNASSWIANSLDSFAGINLGATPVLIDRIAFGRDQTGGQTTRAAGTYTLQFTTVPNPDAATPDEDWQSIGVVQNPGILYLPAQRQLFAFAPVSATGVRIKLLAPVFEIGIDEIEIYGPPVPGGIEAWRFIHFATTANTGHAADLFDFDGDGLVNLVEYAFGLDPKDPSSRQIPSATVVDGHLEIRFTPPAGVSGITYSAQWSTTLQVDDWHTVPNTGTSPEVLFRVPLEGKNRLFIRHIITGP